MKPIIITIALVLLAATGLLAQKNKADEHYKLFQYDRAIPLYEKYVQTNTGDYGALKNLASCYQLTNNVDKAAEIFKTIVSLREANPDDLFQLIQLLRIQQNIAEAKLYAQKYQLQAPGPKADNLLKSLDRYEEFKKTEGNYIMTNKTPGYKSSVYGGQKYRGKLIVTAENNQATTSNWTGRGYTDIFTTDESFGKLTLFAKEVMTRVDDGTPAFTDNGNTMYYTSVHDDFVKNGNINTQKLKIAVARYEGSKWVAATDFPYNSVQYKTAHPAINADGNILVFDSDMPGGKGGMDLYVCTRQGNGWSQPQNLSALNTSENELFPTFGSNGELFFSSDGLPGLGGLDLFTAKKSGSDFDSPENLKAPFNSSYDDFCLFTENGLATGYLSSNRFEDPQIDHVVYFEKTMPATPAKTVGIVISVLDKYTRTPLPYVTVVIKDKSGQSFHQGLTDPEGKIALDELPEGEYRIQGTLNNVSTTLAKVTMEDFNNTTIVKELLHNDPRFTLAGIVVDTRTQNTLEGVLIVCTNNSSGAVKKLTTRPDGKFFFQLEQNSDFEIQGHKKGWLSSETAEKTTQGLDRSQQLYVNLELKIEQPTTRGTIILKKIHYDYDKCDIRPDAAVELNRLVQLMNDYPDMTIELSSHTDSRGSDAYNLTLSQCRAESAVKYLIAQGIQSNRMNAKGYGETRLLNKCGNNIACSDAEHQENRRTEFTILSCNTCPR